MAWARKRSLPPFSGITSRDADPAVMKFQRTRNSSNSPDREASVGGFSSDGAAEGRARVQRQSRTVSRWRISAAYAKRDPT